MATIGLLALMAGCNGEEVAAPECDELGELCHDAGEAGNAEAEACHEFGHDPSNTAEDCIAKLAECADVCATDTDGGDTDT